MKGKVVVNFLVEMTLVEVNQEKTKVYVFSYLMDLDLQWTLSVDGSSNMKGCGIRILLVSPDGERYEFALRFNFWASNNEAEYEALIIGLKVPREIGISNILILSDLQLVVK